MYTSITYRVLFVSFWGHTCQYSEVIPYWVPQGSNLVWPFEDKCCTYCTIILGPGFLEEQTPICHFFSVNFKYQYSKLNHHIGNQKIDQLYYSCGIDVTNVLHPSLLCFTLGNFTTLIHQSLMVYCNGWERSKNHDIEFLKFFYKMFVIMINNLIIY